jgi:hypothetical protein
MIAAVPPTEVLPPVEEILPRLRAALADCQVKGKDLLNQDPLQSLLALTLGGAVLYYLAERGRNDKVRTYWDALEFVATCASVGYSNIFPSTPVGKMVASTLFLLGPNLSARALDPTPAESRRAGPPPGEADLASRLDAILVELRTLNGRLPR